MIKRHGRRTPQTIAMAAAMKEAHYWRWRHKRAMLALEECRVERDEMMAVGESLMGHDGYDWLDAEDDDEQG